MSEKAHKRRVARLLEKADVKDSDEDSDKAEELRLLARRAEEVAREQGYENDFLAVELKEAGQGHHFSLMSAAGYLKVYWRWGAARITEYLESQYDSARDPNAPAEAVAKVFNQKCSQQGTKRKGTLSRYPEQYPGLAEAVATHSYKELREESRHLTRKQPQEILQALFPIGDPFINLGRRRESAGKTRLLSDWKSKWLEKSQLIVPNPMKDYEGQTKQGKSSPKCNDNVLHREHIVVEFDNIESKDRQLGILSYLSGYAPLKMVLFSGGKSLHGWFYCGGEVGQAQWEKFFAIACLFGADRAMAIPSQYCRTPNVKRDNGKLQRLLYLDTELKKSNQWDTDGLIKSLRNLLGKDASFLELLDSSINKISSKNTKEKNEKPMISRCFYVNDGKSSKYAFQLENNSYLPQKETDLKRRLKKEGLSNDTLMGENCSEIDSLIVDVQDNNRVHYMGGLAGHPIGLYEHAGHKFLVDSEATLHEPKKGEFPLLKDVFEGITGKNLNADGLKQFHVFMGWIKRGYVSLRDHNRTTAQQAIVLAGERGAGKSLTSELVISLLGGRSADASRYMLKDNDFNGDLCASEILLLDDKSSSSKIGDRVKFGSQIKTHTVATNNISLHRKGCDAIPVSLFWRIVICVNDNAESLMVLPPLNEDVADKLILLKGHKFTIPWETSGDGERERFWNALVVEMPHFLYWLINEYEMPKEFQDSRYGVTSYHHPEIAEKLNSNSPERVLLELIDQSLWSEGETSWRGTASNLRDNLTNFCKNRDKARTLLNGYNAATGAYLSRLAAKYPDRVRSARTSSSRDWIIYAPDFSNDGMTATQSKVKKKFRF